MAKSLRCLVLFGLTSFVMAETSSITGRLVSGNLLAGRSTSNETNCSNKYGPVCGDCNTLLTCVGDSTPAKIQNCENTHPGQPFCTNNACSSTAALGSMCSVQIRCTSAGYFPNPVNCSQYYVCAGASGLSQLYECPVGFVYNSKTHFCTSQTSACSAMNCTSNANRYVAFATDRDYYAFCLNNAGVSAPIMFKCPNANFKFNQSSQRCEFECPYPGRFSDPSNCRSYYECYLNVANLTYIVLRDSCLSGYYFNQWSMDCRAGSC